MHDILDCCKDLIKVHTAAVEHKNKLRAVSKKYSRKDYEEVASKNNSPLEVEVLLRAAACEPVLLEQCK